MKTLLLVALVCIALAAASPGRFRPLSRRFNRQRASPIRPAFNQNNQNRTRGSWIPGLCANSTASQSVYSQTLQLISTLQSNGSFTNVLNSRANAIAYITNSNNANLLISNCTAFYSGLQAAQNLDRAVGKIQKNLRDQAKRLFFQIIQPFIGNSTRRRINRPRRY